MSCECYKIGGPFIAEDPNCPFHGTEAQMREEEAAAKEASVQTEIDALKARVKRLEDQLRDLSKRIRRYK